MLRFLRWYFDTFMDRPGCDRKDYIFFGIMSVLLWILFFGFVALIILACLGAVQ